MVTQIFNLVRNLGPLPQKAAKNVKILGQFQTNSLLNHEFLQDATIYHQMENDFAKCIH